MYIPKNYTVSSGMLQTLHELHTSVVCETAEFLHETSHLHVWYTVGQYI